MPSDERTNITWSEEHQHLAELVVKKYAGKMGEAGIPTRSNSPKGGITINRSGAILMALRLAAGEAPDSNDEEAISSPIPGRVLADRIEEMDFSPEDIEAMEAGMHEARQVDHARW